MGDLLSRLNALGNAEHDGLEVAFDATEEIIALRGALAQLEDRALELYQDKERWVRMAYMLAEKL
jgi:hypothetical protein